MPYIVPIFDDYGESRIQDYALCDALGVANNNVASDLVKERVDPALRERVVWDPEQGCAFIYGRIDDLLEIQNVIAQMVAEGPNPNAVPGHYIEQSPAWLGPKGN